MQSQDTSNAWAQANSKASAMNTYNADSKAEKKQKRKAANSASQSNDISEQLNKPNEAIVYRLKISKLDPWNAVNYLALGKVYKAQGDIVKSKAMLDRIVSFAPNHPVTLQAKTDLAS